MQFSVVSSILENYRASLPSVNKEIHPNDDMFIKSNGWANYETVGNSTVEWVARSLLFAKLESVGSLLDFGCGHGRNARYLRLAFPEAKMSFSDVDDSGWQFLASQLNGDGFSSVEDFDKLHIPGKYDVIFLGSVFTHLSWERSVQLWRKLFDALNKGGALIATFRGNTCYRMMMADEGVHNMGGYYNPLLEDFRSTGFGYQDYKGFTNWGQNLLTAGKLAELANGVEGASLVCFSEGAWANVHDLGVWSRI